MAEDEYERAFRARIEAVCPGADSTALHLLPENAAHGVLREILETGCLSGHCTNIQLARKALSRVSARWLCEHLPRVVPSCLFQEPEWREWEFRRLAEMLQEQFPDAFAWLLCYTQGLHDPEVDEAVLDYTEDQ